MKVPTSITTSTRAPGTPLAYTQGDGSNGLQRVAQGLGQLGDATSQFAAQAKQRQGSIDKFGSLTNFSDFQQNVGTSLEELKRGYDPSGKGFTAAANDLYSKQMDDFLAKVPPELQPEFKYRAEESKNGMLGKALEFQYQQGDAWFKQGISDELNKSKNAIDQNPGDLDNQQKHMQEIISASDLPEDQKIGLARQANISLAAIQYKTKVRQGTADAMSIGVGPITDGLSGAAALIKDKEGYSSTPYWDVNAWRIGYGSDTITKQDGTHVPVTQGMVINRDDAQRDLNRRTKEFANRGAEQVGAETWNKLPANVQTGLTSVAYNYGSLPHEVVEAVKSGSTEEIARSVENLSANKSRRQEEGAIIRGTQGIEADPAYADIPYEDRIALRSDAEQEARQLVNQQKAQQTQMVAQNTNSLYTGLMDGTAGQTDIDNARKAGWLTDYDSINKAGEILKKTNLDANLAAGGLAKINGGGVFDPSNDQDKKMLNAVVGRPGLQSIQSGDKDYFSDTIVPLVGRTGDIPTDVAGTLTGMVRGNNNTQALYALDALDQLRAANPIAFNQRVTDDVAQAVDLWSARKDIAQSPTDQQNLLNDIRGGTDQATRQAREGLRKEARGILGRNDAGVPAAATLLQSAVKDNFGGFWSTPNTYTSPVAKQGLQNEFNTLFTDAYSKTGNVDSATKLAGEQLKRTWGVTSIGGQSLLMKYPPEKVGYTPINGSYDWINKSVYQDLEALNFIKPQGLSPEETNLLDYSRKNMLNKTTGVAPDGSNISVNIVGVTGPNGRIYNVPGFADGRVLTDEEALSRATEEGLDKYPSYTDGKTADAAAEKVHSFVENDNDRFQTRQDETTMAFQLFSDEQTRQEWQEFQQNPNAPPPSYKIFSIDDSGVAREVVNPDTNEPRRLNFKKPEVDVKAEADAYDRKIDRQKAQEIVDSWPRIQAGALVTGKVIHPEDQKAYDDARHTLDTLDKYDKANQPSTDQFNTADPANPAMFPTGSF